MKSAMSRVQRRRSTYRHALRDRVFILNQFLTLFCVLSFTLLTRCSMQAELNQQQLLLQGLASPSGELPSREVRIPSHILL